MNVNQDIFWIRIQFAKSVRMNNVRFVNLLEVNVLSVRIIMFCKEIIVKVNVILDILLMKQPINVNPAKLNNVKAAFRQG